jgi:hypothetical protein
MHRILRIQVAGQPGSGQILVSTFQNIGCMGSISSLDIIRLEIAMAALPSNKNRIRVHIWCEKWNDPTGN